MSRNAVAVGLALVSLLVVGVSSHGDGDHHPTPSPEDIMHCHHEITNCTGPLAKINITGILGHGLHNLSADVLKQLCEVDHCIMHASRSEHCMATGQDKYTEFFNKTNIEMPDHEVCEKYVGVAARSRLCIHVLLGALLAAMLVGWRG